MDKIAIILARADIVIAMVIDMVIALVIAIFLVVDHPRRVIRSFVRLVVNEPFYGLIK